MVLKVALLLFQLNNFIIAGQYSACARDSVFWKGRSQPHVGGHAAIRCVFDTLVHYSCLVPRRCTKDAARICMQAADMSIRSLSDLANISSIRPASAARLIIPSCLVSGCVELIQGLVGIWLRGSSFELEKETSRRRPRIPWDRPAGSCLDRPCFCCLAS